MTRTLMLALLLTATCGAPALAEEAEPLAPFSFDAVNVPLAKVMEQAKAEKKLIFIDFFLKG